MGSEDNSTIWEKRGILIRLKSPYIGLIFCLGLLAPIGSGSGEATAEQPEPPEWAQKLKAPNQYFDWGADLRVRSERFPNALDRDPHAQDPIREWLRVRTRVWAHLNPLKDVAIRTRLSNESRLIISPRDYTSANPHNRFYHCFDEISVDNLYLELKQPLDSPLTLRLGRQDLLTAPGQSGPNGTSFGDGFLFMDGTPGDGSRTFYFDAIRATIDLEPWIEHSSIDLLAISNRRFSRDHIRPIGGDAYYSLTDQNGDNETYGIYFKNASWIPQSQVDAYYLYSLEEDFRPQRWESGGYRGGYFNTVGARVAGTLGERAKFLLEAAYQFGKGENRITREIADTSGWGTQESLSYTFSVWGEPTLIGYHAFLSGDDPETEKYEAWRPLYNRWPKWGELIGYLAVREDGIQYFTNLHILGGRIDLIPMEKINVMLLYQYLWAHRNSRPEGTGIFGDGRDRGHNPQFKVSWAPAKWFETHALLELFYIGDYFRDRDEGFESKYSFARWEVHLKF
ncbi:MAG: hypothetical protein QHH30_00415 [candidate division NC10 bacterium]|nr:hypothetical protein [candidate division NC10 bacterium]